MDINKDSTWEELTPGGTIYEAGNAREFKTGDWRSMTRLRNLRKGLPIQSNRDERGGQII